MGRNIGDMIAAGALGALCMYHYRTGLGDNEWDKVREFAGREFRDVEPAVLDTLVDMCKQAREAGKGVKTCDPCTVTYAGSIPLIPPP